MKDNDVLVRVEHVSKKFCRRLRKSLWYGVQDIAREINPFGRNGGGRPKIEDSTASDNCNVASSNSALRPDEFWAVNNVSFELRRGECLGLIGRNGAGKTTLLKMLNGLIKPDHGRIEMRGRVGALLALGAGFNPILTGRENIYVNGSVLGLNKREIETKLDDIIDFAEIPEFIDAPVQSYSSGMQVRLGFAIATALDPDVLLLDEVLAVGDAAFRNKCYRRIVGMRKRAAVIFVSHSMEQVSRVCDYALTMSQGRTVYHGPVAEGVLAYGRLNEESQEVTDAFLSLQPPMNSFSVSLKSDRIRSGAPLEMTVRFGTEQPVTDFQFRIYFYNAAGGIAAECCFEAGAHGMGIAAGENRWSLMLDSVPLKNGSYWFSFNLVDAQGDLLVWSYKHHKIEVGGAFAGALADCHLPLRLWKQYQNT